MKKVSKFPTVFSIIFGLLLIIFLFLQFQEYIKIRSAFETIKITRNYYTQCQDCADEQQLSRNHRYFIIRFLEKTELSLNDLKVVTAPKFDNQLEYRMTISDIYTHFTESEAKPLINKINSEFTKNPDKVDKANRAFVRYLQGKLEETGPVIIRTGELLKPNTYYEIKLEPADFNLFVLIFKLPKVNFEFETNSDTTDQEVYEKTKFENIVNQYLMMQDFEKSQREQNEKCPLRHSERIDKSEFFQIIDASNCNPSDVNPVETPLVEIYTQDLEEGKQKFREMSLAPIGLFEGPRLRVQYIHKPGGYISPTPTP